MRRHRGASKAVPVRKDLQRPCRHKLRVRRLGIRSPGLSGHFQGTRRHEGTRIIENGRDTVPQVNGRFEQSRQVSLGGALLLLEVEGRGVVKVAKATEWWPGRANGSANNSSA